MNKILEMWNNWIDLIRKSDNGQFRTKIKDLQQQLKDLKSKDLEHIKELNNDDSKLKSLQNDLDTLKKINKSLGDQLKTEDEVKRPSFLKGPASYRPRRRVVAKDFDEMVTLPKLQYAFDKTPYLNDIITQRKAKGKKTFTDVNKLYKYFIQQWKYKYDKVDNWRPVMDTLLMHGGDCEDSSIVLTSAFGMVGFKADEVGSCLGWYYPKGKSKDPKTRFYHAWTVIKINDRWYILEGTNPRASMRSWSKDKWKDVYQAQEFFNWKFDGKLSETHL